MNEDNYFSGDTSKQKSKKQEVSLAKKLGGRTTFGSGSWGHDKTDVEVGKFKIECKRTDKKSIILKKDWLIKLRKQAGANIPILHLEIQDERWFLVREEEFNYIKENEIGKRE